MQYSAVSKDEEHEFNLNGKIILTGAVVVTRNPCLHPGDVRQFEAVNAPSLSRLVDCIVFPRLGLRPHPNEMSGKTIKYRQGLYFQQYTVPKLLPSSQSSATVILFILKIICYQVFEIFIGLYFDISVFAIRRSAGRRCAVLI